MGEFITEDFLLNTETAKRLYREYAAVCPIIDYHCHINPKEIYENKNYDNITELWLGGDHYKWRYMRCCGIEEKYITGDAEPLEKFVEWSRCLEKAIGNPLYHWSHMELSRYFGITETLNGQNAEKIFALCNEKLKQKDMTPRGIIERSCVKVICTTDDPVDSLEYHDLLEAEEDFDCRVYPAFRPDRALYLEKADYRAYISRLEEVSSVNINDFEDLCLALSSRMDYFAQRGCTISDHGMDYVMCESFTLKEADAVFHKALSGEVIGEGERRVFTTALMCRLAEEYRKRGWVMQLHFGVKRNNNKNAFDALGADTGFDAIASQAPIGELADFLNLVEMNGGLPKTIVYSLNPNDNQAIDTIIGCFQRGPEAGWIQHGSAWWFNDNFRGMLDHLVSYANLGSLATFVGMLTDSRSLLSYTRHEYFRRILCRLIGEWVEEGLYPEDDDRLESILSGICYRNAEKYFGFDRG